jgi:hypothetical protein
MAQPIKYNTGAKTTGCCIRNNLYILRKDIKKKTIGIKKKLLSLYLKMIKDGKFKKISKY